MKSGLSANDPIADIHEPVIAAAPDLGIAITLPNQTVSLYGNVATHGREQRFAVGFYGRLTGTAGQP